MLLALDDSENGLTALVSRPTTYEEAVARATQRFFEEKSRLEATATKELLRHCELIILQREFLSRLEQLKKNFNRP